MADGESQGQNNDEDDDKSSQVENLEVIQHQSDGAEEVKEVNSNSNDEDVTAVPIDAPEQNVDQEVSEQEADDENESVSEDNEREHDRASNGKMNPDPSSVIITNLDDSFSD